MIGRHGVGVDLHSDALFILELQLEVPMLLGFVHSDGLDHEISHFEHTITEDQLALSLLIGE